MSNYKGLLQKNWLQYDPVQQWYQSKGSKSWGKPVHKQTQMGLTKRYLKRETPQRTLSRNNQRKRLSPESKDMLRKRGHVFWKCQNKGNTATPGNPTIENKTRELIMVEDEEEFKYPKKIMLKSIYRSKTDFSIWNNSWYCFVIKSKIVRTSLPSTCALVTTLPEKLTKRVQVEERATGSDMVLRA
ncbi:hypothetical protein Tco_1023055 [Tanacetum coccineum]